MKYIYLILVLILILISGCITTPTATVTIEDVEEEPTEQPEKIEEVQETVEEKTAEAVEEPEEVPEEEAADEELEEETEPEEKIAVIEIKDKKFIPDKLTVDKGTTVRWEHNDRYREKEGIIHMIRIYPIGARSERLEYGDSYNYTFTEANNYWYLDIIFKENMKGYITVK